MSCHCGEPSCGGCDPCNDQDNYCVCLGRQIEQLKSRTDQLKAQLECINTGEPYEGLCPVQTCNSPDCENTGTICQNESPTGRPIGSSEDSCCGVNSPASTHDRIDEIAAKERELSKKVASLEKLVCEVRERALRTVLLDSTGAAKGAYTLDGTLKTFSIGSWEIATA